VRPYRAFTLTEMLVVVAGLSCLTAAALPALVGAKDAASQTMCAANLSRLGTALALWADEHDGYLPDCGAASTFAGPVPRDGRHYPARWDGAGTCAWPHVREVGNQANLWLLVREGYLPARLLVCPATADRPSLNDPASPAIMGFYALDPATGRRIAAETDFLQRVAAGRCSYSYQNQFAHAQMDGEIVAPENATTHRLVHPQTLAVAADRNPYTRPLMTRQPVVSPDAEPEANSPNHGGRGQNVLYLGGHVEWQTSPRCGAMRPDGTLDPIYWPDEGRPDDPLNVPRSPTDSFLVP